MPEMDGYQATAKLRSDPRFAKLTIIAMTAHATIEEKQRCLGAGMNDHISKPIDPNNLFETVGRFYKPATSPVAAEPIRSEGFAQQIDDLPSTPGLDTKDGLIRVAGNRKLYVKLLRQFVDQQGPAVSQINDALGKGDTALAERLAHTLKGVAGNIGAKPVQSAAAILEKAIRGKSPSKEVEAAKERVSTELDPLIAALKVNMSSSETVTPAASLQAAVDPDKAREAAAVLMKLLSEFDPAAAEFIEANRAALQPLFGGERWPQFEQLVQGYAFADAQVALEQALKELPSV
jgi:two-component system sensor histidine kinase/response regulator